MCLDIQFYNTEGVRGVLHFFLIMSYSKNCFHFLKYTFVPVCMCVSKGLLDLYIFYFSLPKFFVGFLSQLNQWLERGSFPLVAVR